MNPYRKIKVKWTQRNIERVHKWLNIKSGFQGFFERDGKRIGYKVCSQGYMTFVFCK